MNLERIINYLNLGSVTDIPKEVNGGLLHKMYAITTTTGKYAVKVLNSEIMKRPLALKNTVNSEKIALALSNDIPVIASLCINDEQIHFFEGNYYMIFAWMEGKSVFASEITKEHCSIIGDILGKIHKLNIQLEGIEMEEPDTSVYDWEVYLNMASRQKLQENEWYVQYEKAVCDIIKWNTEASKVQPSIAQNRVISHRDLDPKNVMWNGKQAYLIDWEAAGYVNPYQELMEIINYWASDENGNINKQYFEAILNEYESHMDIRNVQWDKVFAASYMGMLGWLEYNLKRSLGIEISDVKEINAGEEQVISTIKELYAYQEKIERIRKWIEFAIV